METVTVSAQPWPAPAKLNLFLHVTGRRDDGYHELQTLFLFLDAGDELEFQVTDNGIIRQTRSIPGVADDVDLCQRAARLLQQHSGTSLGADITLHKRLPAGGGLGGGSSDAATTLVALNHLWGAGLSTGQLAELGLRLGADVPVFVRGHAAWAEGVGEALTPVEVDESWYVVICPQVHVSTAEIFARPELTRDSPPITIRAFREGQGRNDLEPVVRTLYPSVDNALNWLAAFGDPRMTGSGSCLFLPVADRDAGEAILTQRPDGCDGFVARALNQSPLVERLEHEA
jgi:4-diphosphocytidyl-2-C-methyl-D-erythritol kinase